MCWRLTLDADARWHLTLDVDDGGISLLCDIEAAIIKPEVVGSMGESYETWVSHT